MTRKITLPEPIKARIRTWLKEDIALSAERVAELLGDDGRELQADELRRAVTDLRGELTRGAAGAAGLPMTGRQRPPSVRTPADPTPLPVPAEAGLHDLEQPGYFLNRELTWLNFNYRVLHEAVDPRTPLLDRLRFLAIVNNNLDEFFMKRIGGLMHLVAAGHRERSVDGRTPEEQIDAAHDVVHDLMERARAVFLDLLTGLAAHDISVTPFEDLPEAQQSELRQDFIDNVYPLVTPQATDPAHPFPFVSNLSLNLLVTLRYPESTRALLARVKVPSGTGVPRFMRPIGTRTFVPLESVMRANLDLLFPGMIVEDCTLFRVTRNANTEHDEDQADDLLSMIEDELRERKFAPVVRLEVAPDMSDQHRGMLANELGLDEAADVFEVIGMLGMRELREVADLPDEDLHLQDHHPVDHPGLTPDRNVFHVIRDAGALLLHHPYQSFSTSVERLLREAARDPKVRAIKMCLYRTSEDTKAINYLIEAARNGKQVAVVVELKARFDEEANIRWANYMEQVGIHVTYGVVGLKTHCKVILVVRQDYDGLRRYAHIGTGNYHAGTARMYSDTGLITCDRDVGADLTELFNYLTTGYKPKRRYLKILPAPKTLKNALIARIEMEVEHERAGRGGLIRMKMNALEDPEVVRALYEAGREGVTIDLIVRDTCRLRPGVPGLTERVRVVSVVGRFLEHARIYHFGNGGDERWYVGSADVMSRNLNSRVEVIVPVEVRALQEELRVFLESQLEHPRGQWLMMSDGSYELPKAALRSGAQHCQTWLVDWHERRRKESSRLKRRKTRAPRRKG